MNVRGAIFDVDGTLLESMSVWDSVGEDYLRAMGKVPLPGLREQFKAMSLYQAACFLKQEYHLSLSPEEMMRGINARIETFYKEEAPLKPGAKELLESLAQKGVKLCAATATDRYLIEAAFARLEILPYFSSIFTCGEVGHGKDEPYIFEAARSFLGTPKSETLIFEDAWYAIQTAKAAGFPVAAVYDSHETAQEAIRKTADFYVQELSLACKLI